MFHYINIALLLTIVQLVYQGDAQGISNYILKGTFYSSRTHLCCAGSVFKQPANYILCCGNTTYDVTKSLCCGGVVFPGTEDSNLKCCGNQIFDSTKQKCCGFSSLVNIPDSLAGTLSSLLSCCGGKRRRDDEDSPPPQVFNTRTQTCCGRTVSPNKGPKAQCCEDAKSQYDVRKELCCGAAILPRTSDTTRCCGKITYDSTTHTCCRDGNKVVSAKTGQQCCGADTLYDPTKQRCCGGKVTDKPCESFTKFRTFCAGKQIDTSSTLCCRIPDSETWEARPKPHPRSACCGKRTYNVDSEVCCGGEVSDNVKHACCLEKLYDTTKEVCCDGRYYSVSDTVGIRPKKSDGTHCCGDKQYNVFHDLCCRDMSGNITVHRNRNFRDFRCCGLDIYDPKEYVCCVGELIPLEKELDWNQQGWKCCQSYDWEKYRSFFTTKRPANKKN